MDNLSNQQLLEQLKTVCDAVVSRLRGSDTERVQAVEVVEKTVRRLQIPREFATSQGWAPAELAGATVGCELGIFQILASHAGQPMSIAEIAREAKGGDGVLVRRIVRLLAAHGMVEQVDDEERYAANELTADYATEARVGNLYTQLATMPALAALPFFLRETGHQNSTDPRRCAWQAGWKTDETLWEWNRARPEMAMHFNNFMTGARSHSSDSLAGIYPFESLFEGSKAEDILFVDVYVAKNRSTEGGLDSGGGLGHQCLNLRRSFPCERGRILLQDLPFVTEGERLHDVEVMAHDMMTEQPVKGAKVYYFRGVLHDHNDEVCRAFLSQIVKAMDENSRLLVHDQLVETVDPSQFITRIDIGMMTLFGAGERSDGQLKDLLESVGLRVMRTFRPGPRQWAITEAML